MKNSLRAPLCATVCSLALAAVCPVQGQTPGSAFGGGVAVQAGGQREQVTGQAAAPADPRLVSLLKGPHRSPANVARDGFRHPLEVISFFGIREDSTVVEILPGSGGYYLELLAPYLKDKGLFIAANRDEEAAPNYLADHQKLIERLKAQPELYGKVQVTPFNAGKHEIAPAG